MNNDSTELSTVAIVQGNQDNRINTNCVGTHGAKKGKFKKEVGMVLARVKPNK